MLATSYFYFLMIRGEAVASFFFSHLCLILALALPHPGPPFGGFSGPSSIEELVFQKSCVALYCLVSCSGAGNKESIS